MNGLNGTFTPDVPHGGYRRLVKGGQTHDYHDQHGAVGSDTEFQILRAVRYTSRWKMETVFQEEEGRVGVFPPPPFPLHQSNKEFDLLYL